MRDLPGARQAQIVEWLTELPFLSFEDLAGRLGVSIMTIHRDVDVLVQTGQATKVHGGVTQPVAVSQSTSRCAMCRNAVPERTAVVIHLASGRTLEACCPHCGLMLVVHTQNMISALAKDYLYGQMINCRSATYLINSDVSLCCQPSVLCFASQHDAQRFQQGFGGVTMSFDETVHWLISNHLHHSS